MLDLSQVVLSISEMGVEVRRRRVDAAKQRELALTQARLEGEAWSQAASRLREVVKTPWPAALCGEEPPAAFCPLPAPPPARYTAIATDGSQIPLDRHAVAPCYLLNIGEIVLHYGAGERPLLTSQATLHYKDDEIFQETDGDPIPLSEKVIANRRLLAESAALAALIAAHHERDAVALVDDPLILWKPQGESDKDLKQTVEKFCLLLEAAQAARTPIAGYISRPGARDVIGALRLTLCEPGCAHDKTGPCAQLSRLTDAQLFECLLLNPGDRSPVFGSAAPSVAHYPDMQKIHFFYLNAGAEIARVEIPHWVAADPKLLDQLHILCFDQARKGQGYPIALSEAHERAVVRAADRTAFFQLVESAFIRQNIPALQTRKALAKRTRVL